MARKHVHVPAVVIGDLKAADRALMEIAALERAIESAESDLNAAVDKLKARTDETTAPWRRRLEALASGLLAYSEGNKAKLFARKRSLELTFGEIGYRRSSEVRPAPKCTWAQVLETLAAIRGGRAAIRIKEEVNREELRGWDKDRLTEIGVRLVEKDTFYYQTRAEVLGEAG